MGIEAELRRRTRVVPLRGEPRQKFLGRLLGRALALPGSGCEDLSPHAYRWVTLADEAREASVPLPDPDGVIEMSLVDQLWDVLEEEDSRDGERLSSRRARSTTSKAEQRRRTHAAGIKQVLVRPHASSAAHTNELNEQGHAVNETTVKRIREYTADVLRAMRSIGWNVTDENGNRVLF